MKTIYLDHAAATETDSSVVRSMMPYFLETVGNPSSLHSAGREASGALEMARGEVAGVLGASSSEIIFTGSGTESDNLAVIGCAHAYQGYGKHIIVSKIEHPATLKAAKRLENGGFSVSYLPVNKQGLVDPDVLKKTLKSDTILVSIMYANNEIGVVEPIKELTAVVAKHRAGNNYPVFHTDACQAAGALSINVKKLGVDLLTLNGAKIYGPKGVGCLFKKSDVKIEAQVVGGGQEGGLRSGSEALPLIVGFAKALSLADKLRDKESKRLTTLRDYFIKKVLATISKSKLNGHKTKRLPNNINISIAGVEGEALL
ncbi:MAG: cysteine desulfurase family protein, partial [bacterium]